MPTIKEELSYLVAFQVTQKEDGVYVEQVKVDGTEVPISELPMCVKDFLLLLPNSNQINPEELAYISHISSEICTTKGEGWFESRVTTIVEKPAPIDPGTPAIYNLEDLCDYFCAETPALLNKRIYRSTSCGASISVHLADGRVFHCGDDWGFDKSTPIKGFTIQTIVEGSDYTVDSELFLVPVAIKEIANWIEEMEAQAEKLWQAANNDFYYLHLEGDYLGEVQIDYWTEPPTVSFELHAVEGTILDNLDEDRLNEFGKAIAHVYNIMDSPAEFKVLFLDRVFELIQIKQTDIEARVLQLYV